MALKLFSYLLIFMTGWCINSAGQSFLQKRITLKVQNQRLDSVLSQIEKTGQFSFSYNSSIVPLQKRVTINTSQVPLESVLQKLLGNAYVFQSDAHHVIIKLKADKSATITGTLIEAETGTPIALATIYDKNNLYSTMSDDKGSFKLVIPPNARPSEIVISKISYGDTVIQLPKNEAFSKPIILQKKTYELDSVVVIGVNGHWLSRNLLSTKQRINSINLNRFFSKQPFQFGIWPSLSSKRGLYSQSINKLSLNILGGYNGGVEGFELGSLFNIVQKDVRYVQLAGLFNIDGGYVKGMQLGGFYNFVAKDFLGWQSAGLFNANGGNFTGFQIGGLVNKNNNIIGVQTAGIANYIKTESKGVQIAGLVNVSKKKATGIQVAGLVNYTKILKGIQVGFINITDTSHGFSVGIININKTGKHSLSISNSEWQDVQIGYKSGAKKLYSIIQMGTQIRSDKKKFSLGYGVGLTFKLSNKLNMVNEVLNNYIYAGSWKEQNLMFRYQCMLQYKMNEAISINMGPAISLLFYKNQEYTPHYQAAYEIFMPHSDISRQLRLWLGWTVGLEIF